MHASIAVLACLSAASLSCRGGGAGTLAEAGPLTGAVGDAPPLEAIPLTGVPVSAATPVRGTRIAWNGTHYGIAVVRSMGPYRNAVDVLLVDPAGRVVQSQQALELVDHVSPEFDPFLVSDLVWNPIDRTFAFACAREGAAWLVLLDDRLRPAGRARIAFDPRLAAGTRLVDVSLVWNPVRRQYAMAAIRREPVSSGHPGDVYLSFLRPDGSIAAVAGADAGRGLHRAVSCPLGCRRTSLAVAADASYRLAYMKLQEDGSAQPMLGIVDESLGFGPHGAVRERAVLQAFRGTYGAGLRLLADPAADGVVIGVAQDGAATSEAGLWLQWASAEAAQPVIQLPGGWDRNLGLSALTGGRRYLACSADGTIRCLSTTGAGWTGEALTSPPGAGPRSAPSHVMGPNGIVLAWAQGDQVYFGPVRP
jgi:hypothetical protein